MTTWLLPGDRSIASDGLHPRVVKQLSRIAMFHLGQGLC